MSLDAIGITAIVIGAVIAWGSSGIPPGGFGPFRGLLREYRSAKEEGKKPNIDAQGAHITYMGYWIGGGITMVGVLIWIVGFLLGR